MRTTGTPAFANCGTRTGSSRKWERRFAPGKWRRSSDKRQTLGRIDKPSRNSKASPTGFPFTKGRHGVALDDDRNTPKGGGSLQASPGTRVETHPDLGARYAVRKLPPYRRR